MSDQLHLDLPHTTENGLLADLDTKATKATGHTVWQLRMNPNPQRPQ